MRSSRLPGWLAVVALAPIAAAAFGCDTVMDFGVGHDSTTDGGAGASGSGSSTSGVGGGSSSSSGTSTGVGGSGGSTVDPAVCTTHGTPSWAIRLGGDENDDILAVAVDSKGDVYVTGYTSSAAFYFDDVNATAGAADGWVDMFLAKVSRDGVVLWSKLLGTATSACLGTFRQRGVGLAVGANDALLVTGRFDCTLDFVGDGTGVCSEANGCLLANGSSPALTPNQVAPDAFVAELSPTGDFQWGRAFGDKFAQGGWDIAASPDGGAFLFGRYQGSLALSPQLSFPDLTGPAAAGFIAKLDVAGKAVWGHAWPGFCSSPNSLSCRLSADAAGNVYFVGEYAATAAPVDVGTGPLDCGCEINSVIGRLNADGSTAWARCVATCDPAIDGEVGARTVAVSKDGARVYAAGRLGGSFTLAGGAVTQALDYDAFVTSYDTAGNPLATRYFGMQRDQEAFGLDTADDGTVFLTGHFRGVLDLEACFVDQVDSLSSSSDGFLLGLDAALVPLWSYRFGNGLPQSFRSARVTPTGEVVAVGTYTGTIDLGLGPLTNRGVDTNTIDVVVAKLVPPAP